MSVTARAGAIVAFRERRELGLGLVVGEARRGRVTVRRPRGREERVNESRVVLEVAPPAVAGSADRFAEVESRVLAAADGVDVAALWEVVVESATDGVASIGTAALAELALGSADGTERAATYLALLREGVRFVLKGDAWVPRAPETVREMLHERAESARREAEREAFFSAIAALGVGEAFQSSGSETERRYLEALELLAVHDDGTPPAARPLAVEALAASGLGWDRPAEGAFRLLLRLGRFTSADVNLQPLRFGLRTEFPEAVLEHARRVAGHDFDPGDRVDLSDQRAVSIDSARTREIDDLLFVERGAAGGFRVAVHIADPAAFVEPGDPVDREASARGLTHYMPDLRLPMMPPAISERAASLNEGQLRPALSFLVELDGSGCVTGFEIVRSLVRSAARLTYEEADTAIAAGGGMLAELAAFGLLREQLRIAGGAVTIRAPEVDVFVSEDGVPRLERLPADSAARRAVSEAMILAGQLAASYAERAGVPAIYRRQAIAEPMAIEGDPAADPVLRRRLRRALTRAETGLEPGPHDSLGLAAYAQVSSPLRRYQDLATHRQIAAHLAGRSPCYDREALQRIAATTEQAETDARRAEQAANEYWILRYLAQRRDRELEAVVVELGPRPVVLLTETLREQVWAGLTGVKPGQTIRVRVEHVNPRAGRLVLQRVG